MRLLLIRLFSTVWSSTHPNGSRPTMPRTIGESGDAKARGGQSTNMAKLYRYAALMRYSGDRGELFAATGPHSVRPTNRAIAVIRRRLARILMPHPSPIRPVISPLLAGESIGERDANRPPVLDDAVLPMLLRGGVGVAIVEQVEYRGREIEARFLMVAVDGQIGHESRSDPVAADRSPRAQVPTLEAREEPWSAERGHDSELCDVRR